MLFVLVRDGEEDEDISCLFFFSLSELESHVAQASL